MPRIALIMVLLMNILHISGVEPETPVPSAVSGPAADASVNGGREWIVDCHAPGADDQGPASRQQPLRTISAAAKQAGPGDVVLVRPGIYRERVAPARGGEPGKPITYKAEKPGLVVVTGADPWTPTWIPQPGGIFHAVMPMWASPEKDVFAWTVSIEGEDVSVAARPATEPLPIVIGQLLVNGIPLDQVETQAQLAALRGSWLVVPAGGAIALNPPAGVDIEQAVVELSTRSHVFAPHRRGLGYIVVSGFIFEAAANQGPFPIRGMVSVRSGHDWVIEDCIIRNAATVGLDCGSESWDMKDMEITDPEDSQLIFGGNHIIRGNHVVSNGLSGIAGWNHRGSKITGNVIEGNNRQRFPRREGGWAEWAGIKLHATTCEVSGNMVRDNNGYGIWIDNGHKDVVIRNNVVLRNYGAGIFLELNHSEGHPCLVTDNVVAWTRVECGFFRGFGIYAHDASDIIIQNNLVLGNPGEAVFARVITERESEGKAVEASRISVLSNLMIGNGGAVALPWPAARSSDCSSNKNYVDDSLFRILGILEGPVPPAANARVAKWIRAKSDDAKAIGGPQPRLGLAAWQQVTGLDSGSREGEVDVAVKERSQGAVITIETPVDAGPIALRRGKWVWAPVR